MNIGLLLPASMIISGETSGVIRQAITYQKALKNKGHKCDFVNKKNGIYDYDFLLIFQHSPELSLLIDRIRIKNKNIKIVFMPIYDPPASPNLIKKLIYRIPTEKIKFFSSPRVMRIACDKSEMVWVRSIWEEQALKATGTKTPIEIVPLTIPVKIDNNLSNIRKDLNFLFVGHLDDDRKNVKRLIKAISKISKTLHLVGRCSENKLHELIDLAALSELKINFHGKVSDKKLINLYARAKVLCLPSLYEGVGLVGLEAACYGANIVITSIGGAPDYFKKNAYYIKNPKDIRNISQNLSEALKTSKSHSFINKNIIKDFSSDKIGSIMEKKLKRINNGR